MKRASVRNKYPNPLLTLSDFTYVPRFRDGRWKFVGQVHNFFVALCFPDCLPIKLEIKIKIEDHFHQSGINPTESSYNQLNLLPACSPTPNPSSSNIVSRFRADVVQLIESSNTHKHSDTCYKYYNAD